ncbi:MAG: arylesterase [Alphaproteobacteria bacterium]
MIKHGALRRIFNGFAVAAGCFLWLLPATPPIAAEDAKPVKIVAIGDSLTAGYGLKLNEAFPAKLQAALRAKGIKAEVVNSGVSGDTSAGGRQRLAWALADKPDFVILELGANDGLRGLEPRQTRENLEAIIVALKEKQVGILLAGMMAPPNLGKQYGDEFNAVFPALAQKHDLPLYPFFLEGVAAHPAFNQADGIHPTAQGVDMIVERILPYVEKLIAAKRG